MKKLFFAAILMFSFATVSFASATTPIDTRILDRFNADFRDASNVQWKVNEGYVEIAFNKGINQLNAYYDMEGEMIGTSTNITFTQLPPSTQKSFNKKYQAYNVDEVIAFNKGNELTYFILVSNGSEKEVLKATGGYVGLYKKI